MSTPAESQNDSYEQALSTSAALFLDLMNTALAARERAACIRQRSAAPEPKLVDRVRELLRRRGSLTPREMRAILGCSSMTVSRALRALVASGHVESRGNTRNLTYRLSQQPDPLPFEMQPPNRIVPDEAKKGPCYDTAAKQSDGPCVQGCDSDATPSKPNNTNL